jgi:hypothetical protein
METDIQICYIECEQTNFVAEIRFMETGILTDDFLPLLESYLQVEHTLFCIE